MREIIIDRFHVVQAINREINRCRVQVMNSFKTKDKPKYNKLKRYWKLLLKAPIDLDRMIYQPYRLFKSWQSQYSLVQYLLDIDDRLKETYETEHRLLSSALKANDIQQLQFILQDSKTKNISQGLKRVIQTFIKYLPYISSTMCHPHTFNEWSN